MGIGEIRKKFLRDDGDSAALYRSEEDVGMPAYIITNKKQKFVLQITETGEEKTYSSIQEITDDVIEVGAIIDKNDDFGFRLD